MTAKYVPLSAFDVCTRFAIDPHHVSVLESLYPGCIEVHLTRCDRATYRTEAGGNGLVIAGHYDELHDRSQARGRYALLAGFDEVFEVACHYDAVVVLRPLGVGLGVRFQLYSSLVHKTSRKARSQKKNKSRANKYLSGVRSSIARLTGTLADRPAPAATGPYFLRETTLSPAQDAKRFSVDTPIVALTIWQAKIQCCLRVAKLASQGWECGEEASARGTMQRPTPYTVAFFCKRRNATKWVVIKCGQAQPGDPEEMKWLRYGGPKSYTVDEIVDAQQTWHVFPGFSGESCGRCLAQANVLAGGPQWICGCGHHNLQSWSCHQMPHEQPDFGPSSQVLQTAYQKYRDLTGKEF